MKQEGKKGMNEGREGGGEGWTRGKREREKEREREKKRGREIHSTINNSRTTEVIKAPYIIALI